jgi:hypothetical protein
MSERPVTILQHKRLSTSVWYIGIDEIDQYRKAHSVNTGEPSRIGAVVTEGKDLKGIASH